MRVLRAWLAWVPLFCHARQPGGQAGQQAAHRSLLHSVKEPANPPPHPAAPRPRPQAQGPAAAAAAGCPRSPPRPWWPKKPAHGEKVSTTKSHAEPWVHSGRPPLPPTAPAQPFHPTGRPPHLAVQPHPVAHGPAGRLSQHGGHAPGGGLGGYAARLQDLRPGARLGDACGALRWAAACMRVDRHAARRCMHIYACMQVVPFHERASCMHFSSHSR